MSQPGEPTATLTPGTPGASAHDGEPPNDEVAALRDEVAELRTEVHELRDELRDLRASLGG